MHRMYRLASLFSARRATTDEFASVGQPKAEHIQPALQLEHKTSTDNCHDAAADDEDEDDHINDDVAANDEDKYEFQDIYCC